MHLLWHDLRTHWRLFAVWGAIVAAHPVVAFIPWDEAASSLVWVPAMALVIARLVLVAVIAAVLVQADSPADDRSFWRTRPIRPASMMWAKLAQAALVFVGVPLVVVLGVAAALRVPLAHWPSTVGQVLAIDAAWVGLALVAAAYTRRVSAALVALPAAIVVLWAVLGNASDLARRLGASPAIDERLAVPTMCLSAGAALWCVAALSWWGPRRRPASAAVAVVGLVLVVAAWLFPSARLHARPPAPVPVTLTLSSGGVRAEPIDPAGTRVALQTTATVTGSAGDVEPRLWLRRARLVSATSVVYEVDGPSGIDRAPSISLRGGTPHVALLGVVDAARARALAGRRLQFTGAYRVEMRREHVMAAGPLATGGTLALPNGRMDVHAVRRPTGEDTELARASLVWISGATGTPGPPLTSVRLRGEHGTRYDAIRSHRAAAGIASLLIVPSLARPFGWLPMTIRILPDDVGLVDPSHLRVELVRLEQPVIEHVNATLTFTMPALDGAGAR